MRNINLFFIIAYFDDFQQERNVYLSGLEPTLLLFFIN